MLTAKDIVSRSVDKDAVLEHLGKAGDLIVVPADPHMADGGTIDWDVLRPQTREAFLDIAEDLVAILMLATISALVAGTGAQPRRSYAIFERELGRADLLLFRRIASFLPAGPERAFILETLGSLEAAQLKTALRIWHNRLPVAIEDRLIDPAVLRPLDYAGIARASSIEEIVVLLSGTPYAAPVAAA